MNVFYRFRFVTLLYVCILSAADQLTNYRKLSETSCKGDDQQTFDNVDTAEICATKCDVIPYCSSFDFTDNNECTIFFHHKQVFQYSESTACYTKIKQNMCNQSFPFAFEIDKFQYGCCETPITVFNETRSLFCSSNYYPVIGISTDFYSTFDNSLDRFCECNEQKCEEQTDVMFAKTSFDFGKSYEYLPKVEETFLEFYNTDTDESLQAEGCGGPQNRMEGSKWEHKDKGLCACSKQNTVASSKFYCDPTQSCAYHEEMRGLRGLFGLHFYAHTSDSLECFTFLNFAQAEQWCVYNHECVGLLQSWNENEYCAVSESTVFEQFTVKVEQTLSNCGVEQLQFETDSGDCKCCENFQITDGHCKPSHRQLFLLTTHNADYKDFKEATSETKNHVQDLRSFGCTNDAMAATTNPTIDVFNAFKDLNMFESSETSSINDEQKQLLITGKDYTGSLSSAKAFATFCKQNFFYFRDNPEDPHLGTFSFSETFQNFSPGGTYTKYVAENDVQRYQQCPKRENCVHGTSFYDTDSLKCSCRCDEFWTGALCDECTSANKQEDCKLCKENFNTGYNDMCICTSGYDITTACTTCLPGIAGVFCQTDLCSYTLHEALDATAVDLNNIVVAYNHEKVLYDGVKSAGDGRIPLSMQFTFALQGTELWWLSKTSRHFVTKLSLDESDYFNLNQWKIRRNVHSLKGEWLFSLQSQTGITLQQIIKESTFYGKVCMHAGQFSFTTTEDNSEDCAQKCAETFQDGSQDKCGSWHFNNNNNNQANCGIYTERHLQNLQFDLFQSSFTASEYFVSDSCVSGGIYGAGPNRNLPNNPTFAVPDEEEMLLEIPSDLRGRIICAHDDDTPYVLSEFRRHKLTSTLTCTDENAVIVQFTWLYSIPRGAPFTIITTREQWWSNELYPKLDASTLINDKATVEECKASCDKQVTCFLWAFDQNNRCFFTDGKSFLAQPTDARFVYGGVIRSKLSEEKFTDIRHKPRQFAVPSVPELAASVPSRQACCEMCSEFASWDMAGALCSCYGNLHYSTVEGGEDDVKECRVNTILQKGKKCSMSYNMKDLDKPFSLDPEQYFGCQLSQVVRFADEQDEGKRKTFCQDQCHQSSQCDVASLLKDSVTGLDDPLFECRMYFCPNFEISRAEFKIKYKY